MRQFTAAVVSYNGNKPHNKPHNKLPDTGHGNQPAVNGGVEEWRRRFSECRWALNFAINYKFGAHHRVESFLPSSSPPYSAPTPTPSPTHTHTQSHTHTHTEKGREDRGASVYSVPQSPACVTDRRHVSARAGQGEACGVSRLLTSYFRLKTRSV